VPEPAAIGVLLGGLAFVFNIKRKK